MKFSSKILIVVAIVCFGRGEVKLKLNKNEIVAFEGDELIIKVDNPQSNKGRLELCFGSRPDATEKYCPRGYGGASVTITEITETYKLNRQGKFLKMRVNMGIDEEVVFNPDGSINVLVVAMPNEMTVSLPNAAISIVTTTASVLRKKETSSNAALRIVFLCVPLILLLLIIGAVLLYCCWYKKRGHRPNQMLQTPNGIRQADESLPQTVVEIYPVPKRPASKPKRTSNSTTKASDEKPQAAVASAPMSTPGETTKRKVNASKKSRRQKPTTPMNVEKSAEPSSMSQEHGNDSGTYSQVELPR
uniref:Uncharacterized protein n=1 Tax=Panagrellus redivivus TaxID=6233 RepID=A0A7E4ZXB6_PANRE